MLYWRVLSCANNHNDGVSEARALTPMLLTITAPAADSEELELPITATWYTCGSDEPATLQLAADDEFTSLIYTGSSTTGSLVIPEELFEPGNTYFLRVILTVDGETMTSKTVRFSVAHAAALFTVPIDGGTLYSRQHLTLKPQQWAKSYVIEISSKEDVWGRYRYVETLRNGKYKSTPSAGQVKVDGNLMVDGVTYYARCRSRYQDFDGVNHATDYGPVISFVYRESGGLTGDVNGDEEVNIADVNAVIIMILSGELDLLGDVNNDGEVNIADVNAIIDIILNGESAI